MCKKNKNIVFQDYEVTKSHRSQLMNHGSKVLWFTGLSGSGKSTIANKLEFKLHSLGYHTYTLDGDNLRMGLNSGLSFSQEDRNENLRRIAEVAKLMIDSGIIVLAAFVSPLKSQRNKVRKIIGNENFLEIFVNTPLEECEKRDVKGLYEKARRGEIANFTGISSPYEKPDNPEIEVQTINTTVDRIVEDILSAIRNEIKL